MILIVAVSLGCTGNGDFRLVLNVVTVKEIRDFVKPA
jgi:hypothetical protein